ncbi:hypothetical protein AY601_5001 [Pedobacter cryoconitis]|uniref:Lipocalin-like domain-containing protein n=1 Tax=Pedobacter cryoconitis TaxID=188932 RepID=A0A127VKM7_9SPHI|nr:hypothetical protein [Pedobacter cryoconitis]AMQ01818.1 hypothetical protein AY601_5001 [Pedobacter cryoconitis]
MKEKTKTLSIVIFMIIICSCKKTISPTTAIPVKQDLEIAGNWSLNQTVNILTDKNGKLFIDSVKAIKGYTDDLSFDKKGFRIKDKVVSYSIVNIKNENYIKYAVYDSVIMLKLIKKDNISFVLESSDSTSSQQRITKYYFQKD